MLNYLLSLLSMNGQAKKPRNRKDSGVFAFLERRLI